MSAVQAGGPPAESRETGKQAIDVAPASPDGFRLGREPPQVMRLSRKTLAVAGVIAGTAIGGALFWALRPSVPEPPEVLYRARTSNRADVVTAAPADYAEVAERRPALPGDPAPPTVSAQRNGEAIPVPPMARARPGLPLDPAAQEREAARSSRLFLGVNGHGTARGMEERAATATAPPPSAFSMSADAGSKTPPRRPPVSRIERRSAESDERIQMASSPNVLQAGSVIPAALITGIRSDLPGQVTAQVTQNVYDSPTGRILLIPQGARLIGEYDSDIAAGQDRVLLTWHRLILPGGRSIQLGGLPGADAAGMAGLSDRTDFHWGRVLRAALVSTVLGVGAELGTDSDDRLARALRDGSQDTLNQSGQQLVERELRVAPTLTIRPGFPLRVIVTRDLIIEESKDGDDR